MNRDQPHSELDERTRRQLASLADGSLQGHERAELEARLAASPTLRAALERQRAGSAALRGLQLGAPHSLRARVEAARAAPRRRTRRRPRLIAGTLAGAAAAAALVTVLLLPSGAGGPTVVEAARLSERPATGSVAVAPSNPKLLAADVEGVPYPNWSEEFGWRQAGIRSDRLGDRDASTVFYERGGRRIAYTIVSGDGIHAPGGARTTVRNGVNLHSLDEGGRRIVTWWRDGRTCVLSSTGVGDRELLRLASWKGDGAVPF
ncbi:MAG TPA: hypothetical protein VGJ61_08235 [Solirubrobacterales bacterium]